MKKDITIAGNTYQDVPFISAPSGDGVADFYEISDTTAEESHVLQNKYFYTANGEKKSGTIATITPQSQTNLSSYTHRISVNKGGYKIPIGYNATEKTIAVSEYVTPNSVVSGYAILGVSGATTNVNVASTTATAEDVVGGKYFYANDGTRTAGSLTISAPTITVNSTNGLITATANGKTATKGQNYMTGGNTITPSKNEQTAVSNGGIYVASAIKVGAIPDEYIVPSGSQTITSNDTYDVTNLASVVVNVAGGGIANVTELYSNNAESITYTSTSAGTAKSITGITGIASYPFVVVVIESSTADTASSLKFRRSATVIANNNFASNTVSVTRYGAMQYYNSSSTSTQTASTSYGLWGYTFTNAGTLTIRGRCNGTYFTSLTGTYKVKVLGIKF